jgi:hypothetical protein
LSAAQRVRIDLAPSLRLAAVLVFAHAMAGASAVMVLQGTAGALLGAGLLALGLAAAWSRALLLAAGSVRSMELEGERIVLHLRDGRRLEARMAERRYVGRWMVALPVRSPVRRTILVTADMAGRRWFRVLRIWAAWGKTPAAAAKHLQA